MRLLCCYTEMHPATSKALADFAPHADLIDVTGDRFLYWRSIAERWDGTEDLVIIEQDIEITRQVIDEFQVCERPWCTFGYRVYSINLLLYLGLGCTRFSASLQQEFPWQSIADKFRPCTICDDKVYGCWHLLDGPIKSTLRQKYDNPHVHGQVAHHHDYKAAAFGRKGLVNGRVPFEQALFMMSIPPDLSEMQEEIGFYG